MTILFAQCSFAATEDAYRQITGKPDNKFRTYSFNPIINVNTGKAAGDCKHVFSVKVPSDGKITMTVKKLDKGGLGISTDKTHVNGMMYVSYPRSKATAKDTLIKPGTTKTYKFNVDKGTNKISVYTTWFYNTGGDGGYAFNAPYKGRYKIRFSFVKGSSNKSKKTTAKADHNKQAVSKIKKINKIPANKVEKLYQNYMDTKVKGASGGKAEDLKYSLLDINTDGIKDLITYQPWGARGRILICTIVNGKVKKLFDVHGGGGGLYIDIKAKKIAHTSSGGASLSYITIYEWTGTKIKETEEYSSDTTGTTYPFKNAIYKHNGKKISYAKYTKATDAIFKWKYITPDTSMYTD